MMGSSAGKNNVKGALLTAAVCLLASGLLRIGDPTRAIARELSLQTQPETNQETPELSEVQPADPAACLALAEPGSLLAALHEREQQLDARQEQIASRLQALAVAESKMQENTAALVRAEQRLAATLAIADQASEKDLASLTAVYENMKAKNAADLFSNMAPDFAAGFLSRMRADSAAGIMSNLPPESAYAISVVIPGRNARAPAN